MITQLSFRVKICLSVSCLKAQYMLSVANKLHKWSPTSLIIINEDATLNRKANLIQSSSRSIAQDIHIHNIRQSTKKNFESG